MGKIEKQKRGGKGAKSEKYGTNCGDY